MLADVSWAAHRDMHDAERTGQERQSSRRSVRCGVFFVRVAGRTCPGQQSEQDRERPRAESERAADQPGQRPADLPSISNQAASGREHRQRQHGQPGTVPAVRGVEFAGAVAEPPGQLPPPLRDLPPEGCDHPQQPADQDQERVPGPPASPRPGRAAAALPLPRPRRGRRRPACRTPGRGWCSTSHRNGPSLTVSSPIASPTTGCRLTG